MNSTVPAEKPAVPTTVQLRAAIIFNLQLEKPTKKVSRALDETARPSLSKQSPDFTVLRLSSSRFLFLGHSGALTSLNPSKKLQTTGSPRPTFGDYLASSRYYARALALSTDAIAALLSPQRSSFEGVEKVS